MTLRVRMRTKLATADRMEARRTISILKTRDLFFGSRPSSMKLEYFSTSNQKSHSAGDMVFPNFIFNHLLLYVSDGFIDQINTKLLEEFSPKNLGVFHHSSTFQHKIGIEPM